MDVGQLFHLLNESSSPGSAGASSSLLASSLGAESALESSNALDSLEGAEELLSSPALFPQPAKTAANTAMLSSRAKVLYVVLLCLKLLRFHGANGHAGDKISLRKGIYQKNG